MLVKTYINVVFNLNKVSTGCRCVGFFEVILLQLKDFREEFPLSFHLIRSVALFDKAVRMHAESRIKVTLGAVSYKSENTSLYISPNLKEISVGALCW